MSDDPLKQAFNRWILRKALRHRKLSFEETKDIMRRLRDLEEQFGDSHDEWRRLNED